MKQLSENDSRRAAQAWVERYGESLLAEAEAMREQGVAYRLPRADRAVQKVASRRGGGAARRGSPARPGRSAWRRRTAVLAGLAAAACLAVVVWVAGIPTLTAPPSTSPGDAVVDAPTPAPPSDAAQIPISFELPASYRVASTDYDNGTSLYALESAAHGDVVLAMYRENRKQDAAAGSGTSFAAMDEVLIDGAAVSAKVDEAYMLLAFEREGVRYTLSSRDDMGALAAFYRSIVRA
ncbi:MAG: hypothetical protein LBL86_07065 [Coriobacteriales bacterium]|jgi:hypothetical protein|nr:hypothetical protein [Coriobacteriales bacterium]